MFLCFVGPEAVFAGPEAERFVLAVLVLYSPMEKHEKIVKKSGEEDEEDKTDSNSD